MDRPDWIIETDTLGHRFGDQPVLEDITLQIKKGEIFGLLGPDGAGKTTLMQILAAILDPTQGTCRVLGFDTVRQSAQITSRIGYMSQGFTLYDRLSVDENLNFAARVRGIRGDTWRQRRERLLSMAGLTAFGDRRAGDLSGGMRKKLSLCTNLIHQPPLLLLDELSLGVDPASRRDLWHILREFQATGITIVLTTPYMDEAGYCDRLGLLNHGKLLAVDSPRNLQQASREATEVSLPSLEEVFIRLSGKQADKDEIAKSISSIEPSTLNIADSDAVVADQVTCRFGDFVAVDRVSLRVRTGEVFGFLGPNGAGKTTLIRAMCGLLRPSEGELQVAGIDVRRDPVRLRQHIGYMSQRFSLYPDLTVGENLRFFAGVYGLKGPLLSERIAWAREMTGLNGMATRMTGQLSSALRQRLALACSILHRPAVLFLDEPTSGVDPASRRRFWHLIQTLAHAQMTIFVTTHYLEEAHYCSRLGLMFQGRLIASGTIEQLRAGLEEGGDDDMEAIFMAYIDRERARDPKAVGAG